MHISEQYTPGLVTVIIPTYNRAWALRKTVAAVFEQSWRPVECLVIDDGSTDETAMVMAELRQQAPAGIELRYVKQENGGANSARNHGLRICTGEFICFLDSDDSLLPESVAARAEVLLRDPEVDLCYGLCSVQDEHGREVRIMNSPWPEEGQARIAAYLFHTSSPLIRRRTCQLAGHWKLEDSHSQEYEFFARIKFFARKVIFIDRVLSIYLRHQQGNIFDLKQHAFILAIFRALIMVKGLVLFSSFDSVAERRSLADQLHWVAKELYTMKDYRNAVQAIRESLLLHWQGKRALQKMFLCAKKVLFSRNWK